MKLKCGVHAEREGETRPIFVCHHCGMPVCEEHGWVVAVDDAFDEVKGPVSQSAMHCPECAAEYHPRGVSKRHGWLVKGPRSAAGQEALAAPQPEPPTSQKQPPPAPGPRWDGPQPS